MARGVDLEEGPVTHFYLEKQTSASSNNLAVTRSVKLLFARSYSRNFARMRNPKSRRARIKTEPVNKRPRVEISPSDSKDDLFQVKNFTAVVESSFKSIWYALTLRGK